MDAALPMPWFARPDIMPSDVRSAVSATSATRRSGANYLCRHGKVAIIDVDYHHGNGQQDIFYERSDVLTVSIHGDPDFAYPYFTGFADERGAGAGEGFNLNIALPEVQDGAQYRKALQKAIRAVRDFAPAFLVIALGLDPAKGDPTGTWSLGAKDFEANGRMLGSLHLPTLVVQEGGYRTRTLGKNAKSFFPGPDGWCPEWVIASPMPNRILHDSRRGQPVGPRRRAADRGGHRLLSPRRGRRRRGTCG